MVWKVRWWTGEDVGNGCDNDDEDDYDDVFNDDGDNKEAGEGSRMHERCNESRTLLDPLKAVLLAHSYNRQYKVPLHTFPITMPPDVC